MKYGKGIVKRLKCKYMRMKMREKKNKGVRN
jgi:hypothetical protein